MTPEGKIKVKVYQWLKDHMPGLWMYAPPGGAFGAAGTADRIGWWRGVPFAMEIKKDRSNPASPLQLHRLRTMKRAGAIVAVLYGFELDKLMAIKQSILDRTPSWDGDERTASEVRGLPVSDNARSEGDAAPD